jgi:hypothetical protein
LPQLVDRSAVVPADSREGARVPEGEQGRPSGPAAGSAPLHGRPVVDVFDSGDRDSSRPKEAVDGQSLVVVLHAEAVAAQCKSRTGRDEPQTRREVPGPQGPVDRQRSSERHEAQTRTGVGYPGRWQRPELHLSMIRVRVPSRRRRAPMAGRWLWRPTLTWHRLPDGLQLTVVGGDRGRGT